DPQGVQAARGVGDQQRKSSVEGISSGTGMGLFERDQHVYTHAGGTHGTTAQEAGSRQHEDSDHTQRGVPDQYVSRGMLERREGPAVPVPRLELRLTDEAPLRAGFSRV